MNGVLPRFAGGGRDERPDGAEVCGRVRRVIKTAAAAEGYSHQIHALSTLPQAVNRFIMLLNSPAQHSSWKVSLRHHEHMHPLGPPALVLCASDFFRRVGQID